MNISNTNLFKVVLGSHENLETPFSWGKRSNIPHAHYEKAVKFVLVGLTYYSSNSNEIN